MKKELPYYIALQPIFKKNMGELQEGDWYVFAGSSIPQLVDSTNVEDLNNSPESFLPFLRLPFPIDDSGQGRGLWDMVDWKKLLERNITKEGLLRIGRRIDRATGEIIETTPTLALLKAIAAQNNVEVKE